MDRENLFRRLFVFLLVAAWAFVLLSMASFHADDWPSHQVYPYPPIQNLCGAAGAFLAYHISFIIGQGIFPILLFTGICLWLLLCHNRISDLWLRAIGLLLLSVAFAGMIHLIRPGSIDSFPEGDGGLLGIITSTFLKARFNTAGTSLILLTAFLVGLLLAADDLVIRAPALITTAVHNIKAHTPHINWRFPTLPKLPALPRFVTRDSAAKHDDAADDEGGGVAIAEDEGDDDPTRRPTVLRQNVYADGQLVPLEKTVNGQQIDLEYDHDKHPAAAVDTAYVDDSAAPPAALAVIPPPEQQVVAPQSLAIINNAATRAAAAPPPLPTPAVAPAPAAAIVPEPEIETADDEDEEEDADGEIEDAAGEEAVAPVEPLTGIVVRSPAQLRPRVLAPPPPKELGEYAMPGWECLAEAEHGFAEAQEKYVREKAAELENALREFNIDARVVEIDTGPVITMYELSLAAGIKVAAITQLTNDIARALMAVSVRIVAPVPGKNTVGIEVPNPHKEKVRLKELMQLAPEATRKMQIPLYLGKDASGIPLVADMCSMPHCLIAGTTGSGKSVCINTIIMSIMYTQRPDQVKLILVDPKVVEMAPFKDIPHLMCPVINDSGRACSVLEWACEKMDERYEVLAEAGVRNLAGYNKLTTDELYERFKPSSDEEAAKIPKFLPYIIIIIDELADHRAGCRPHNQTHR